MNENLQFDYPNDEGLPTKVFPTFIYPKGRRPQNMPPEYCVVHPDASIDADAKWGKYILPAKTFVELRSRSLQVDEKTIRVAQLGSFIRGLYVGGSLLQKEGEDIGKMEMRGIATDGIIDEGSKVTAHRRVWQYLSKEDQAEYQEIMEDLASRAGIPAYTGNVKSDFFRKKVLPAWDPQVIFMSTFGQLIDNPIIEYPKFGMYNFHPSHLAEGKYPGGNPFNEMIDAGETTTRMTIHTVDAGFDAGAVVGYSPELNIQHGSDDIRRSLWIKALHVRTSQVAGVMVRHLIDAIYEARDRVCQLDMEEIFSEEEKELLMEPLHIPASMYQADRQEQLIEKSCNR